MQILDIIHASVPGRLTHCKQEISPMKRTLRLLALVLMILAIIGVFNTPITRSTVAYADGTPTPPFDPNKLPTMNGQ